MEPRSLVPLAPLTTLGLGGDAEFFAEAVDEASILEAVRWAKDRGVPLSVLGGGSNLVVGDDTIPGLVLAVRTRGVKQRAGDDGRVRLTAAAGESWDGFVRDAVARDLAGVECLAGIPGLVGATPIQNVGAYGQEVSDTIESVRVLDRRTNEVHTVAREACGFAYRHSAFKERPEDTIVLDVTFALTPGGAPSLRYGELTKAFAAAESAPTLASVREKVIALRRGKSMVVDPADENRHSAGSFFTNPIVTAEEAKTVAERAVALGVATSADKVPQFPADHGRVKLAAGWLIEAAGLRKGERHGAVGISSRHALALVHHGGGTTQELLALARHVRDRVHGVFGVTLVPEPVMLGVTFDAP